MSKPYNSLILSIIFLFSISLVSASSMSWNFSIPSDYVYNSSLIEVAGGIAHLIAFPISPYAWYHLNETSGTAVSDSSGNGRNGTTVNSPSWVAGKLNNSIQLNGSSQYINLGTIAPFERTSNFSIEAWIYPNNVSSAGGIISKAKATAPYNGWTIYISGTKLKAQLINTDPGNLIFITGSTILTDNTWYHIVVTYNGSSTAAGLKMYINGVLETPTVNQNSLSASILSSESTNIGLLQTGANPFKGKIDELVIYNQTLNQSTIDFRYNSGTGTETMAPSTSYPTSNPAIYPVYPFSFINPIQTISETATKPSGTEIKYHSSFDNGTIWKYWNETNWITTDDSYTQANIISDINSNIATLNSTGLFKFRALFNSDGTANPLLDLLYASDTLSYPQISNVSESSITSNSADINWITDLSSNSSVIYGTSFGNLNLTNSSSTSVTTHIISLSSLNENTTYFYNVTSCSGIACNSTGTYNFTTLVIPPAPNLTIGSIVQLISLYKQDTAADIKIACFDNSNNYCTAGVTCSLTIFNPDSSTLISNQQMTYNPTFFSYSLNTSQTHDLGTYTGTVLCSSTNNVNSEIEYQVTPNGQITSTAQSGLSIGILLSIALTMFFFAFLAFKLMDYEKTFSIAIFFFVLSIILSLFGLYLGLVYSRDYLSASTAAPQSALFISVLYGLMGLMFIGLLWLILAVIKEFKIRKSERDHGENWDSSTKSYRY